MPISLDSAAKIRPMWIASWNSFPPTVFGSAVAAITGALYDADTGAPIEGVNISIMQNGADIPEEGEWDPEDDPLQYSPATAYESTTGPDGAFIFSGIEDGTYSFYVEDYYFDETPFAVIQDQLDVLNMALYARPVQTEDEPAEVAPYTSGRDPVLATDGAGNNFMVWNYDNNLWVGEVGKRRLDPSGSACGCRRWSDRPFLA